MAAQVGGLIAKMTELIQTLERKANKKQRKAYVKSALEHLEEAKKLVQEKELNQLQLLKSLYESCKLKSKPKDKYWPMTKEGELSEIYFYYKFLP